MGKYAIVVALLVGLSNSAFARDDGRYANDPLKHWFDNLTRRSIPRKLIMERVICWRIPRLWLIERGAASWQDGGKRSRWR